VGGVGEQRKTKAIRCGACYYSIVLNAHRITSMADTDIDAVKKRKNAEGIKQYRLTGIVDMDMSYARMVRTASLTSYPVRCKILHQRTASLS
jgi:hypothetical protein